MACGGYSRRGHLRSDRHRGHPPHAAGDGRPPRAVPFLSPSCPLSVRYVSEAGRIFADYSSRRVVVFAIAGADASALDLPFPVLVDANHSLARQTGASVTPQAIVLGGGRVLYRGRIDDRTIELGKSRPQATRQDLRQALDEILAGKPVTAPETKAVGCAISFPAKTRGGGVTFTKNVAPILFRRCWSCHRPGQTAAVPAADLP